MFKHSEVDDRMRNVFQRLPMEPIGPFVKMRILERVKREFNNVKREVLFLTVFFRVSQAALASSLAVLAFFIPTIFQFQILDNASLTAQKVEMTIEDDSLKETNTIDQYNLKPYASKSGMRYANYVSYP